MFVAGISAVGIAHQVVWLARSNEPLFASSWSIGQFESKNHLQQIALAVQTYHERHAGQLPPGSLLASDGAALHGWQTLLLPYLDEGALALFQQIDLSRPWHAPGNRDVFKREVWAYRLHQPTHDADGFALSHYSANQHVVGGARPFHVSAMTDGTSNTILAGEVAEHYKPWGHPRNWRDPAAGINRSPDGFGSPWPGGAQVIMPDGSIRFLSDDTDPRVLRALATPAGGERADEGR
jgi:hypothetical protein